MTTKRSRIDLRPAIGHLSARLFENQHIGLPLALFFDMEIPIEPFVFQGEEQKTAVRLNFIQFPVGDWKELIGREFEFPVNPQPGYIDGSLYLDHVHNPTDVTRLRFGMLEGSNLPVALRGSIDFALEGPEELGTLSFDWSTRLLLNLRELDQIIAEARVQGVLPPRVSPRNRRPSAGKAD